MKRFTLALSWLYLAFLIGVWGLLQFGSEYHWPVTVLLFAPRWLLATPLLVLLPMAFFSCRRWIPLFAVHVAILLFPIMGLQIGRLAGTEPGAAGVRLCIITCNVGGGEPRVDQLVALIELHDPHVVTLQECDPSIAEELFQRVGWQFEHRDGLATGSRCPLQNPKVVSHHGPGRYNKAAALACTIDLSCIGDFETAIADDPESPAESDHLRVINVHLPTMRPALEPMLKDPLDNEANLGQVIDEYARVSAESSAYVLQIDAPLVVAGDFNMPVASTLFRHNWGHLRNAYSIAGLGLGHTKFTRIHGVRIDHVLANDFWSAVSAEVGPDIGGDHRPVVAEFEYQP